MSKPPIIRVIRITVVVLALGFYAFTKSHPSFFAEWGNAKATSSDSGDPGAATPVPQTRQFGKLTLTRCALGPPQHALYASVEGFCTNLSVPENWDEPNQHLIELHLAIIPSHSAGPKPDPVVILDGGPGGAATEDYPGFAAAFAKVLDSRNIILMDQRGTGSSHALHCDFKDSQEGNLDQAIDQCLKTLGSTTQLQYYTTTQTTRDLDFIRSQLGVAQWNVFGVSYGTRVAQQYALHFGASTRSLILDSPVPNTLALSQDHSLNLETALDSTYKRCADDADCQKHYPQLTQSLSTLKAHLVKAPQTVTIPDPWDAHATTFQITADNFAQTIRLLTYSSVTAALIPYLVNEASAGRWQPLATTVLLVGRSLNPISRNNILELSILCSEDADRLKSDEAQKSTLLGTKMVDGLQRICRRWPKSARPADFNQPLTGAIPTLLLAGREDPVTPVRYADAIASSLSHAKVLIFEGNGHAQLGSACTPSILDKFIKTLDFAQLPTACINALGPREPIWTINGPKA